MDERFFSKLNLKELYRNKYKTKGELKEATYDSAVFLDKTVFGKWCNGAITLERCFKNFDKKYGLSEYGYISNSDTEVLKVFEKWLNSLGYRKDDKNEDE